MDARWGKGTVGLLKEWMEEGCPGRVVAWGEAGDGRECRTNIVMMGMTETSTTGTSIGLMAKTVSRQKHNF